jgi:hypothetical protein
MRTHAAANARACRWQVVDVSRACLCHEGPLQLSPGAALTWAAFSREGCLATMDRCACAREERV